MESSGRCHRLTFSKSLAELLQARASVPLLLVRRTFQIGAEIAPGVRSASGAYAIVDARKGKTLRIALQREVADLLRSPSRRVHECWLV